MTQSAILLESRLRRWRLWVVLAAAVVALLSVAAYLAWARAGLVELLDKRVNRESLALEQKTLSGRAMGAVKLAGRLNREIKEAAQYSVDAPNRSSVAASALRTLASEAEAEQAFVINRQGRVSAEWTGSSLTAIGLDVSFRHYFARAMEGQASVSLAVSLSTNDRRLFIAAPIYANRDERDKDDVIGVLLLQQSIDRIDDFLGQWPMTTGLLVSPGGVVMASNRPDWLLRPLGELGPDRLRQLQADRLYGGYFKTSNSYDTLPDVLQGGWHNLDGNVYVALSSSVNFNHREGDWRLVYLGDQRAAVTTWQMLFVGLTTGLLTIWIGRLLVRRRADAFLQLHQRRELRASQARIETMIRNVPGVVYRSAALPPWQMEYLSPAVESLTGYPPSDFTGESPVRSMFSLMSPEDADQVTAQVQRAVEQRDSYVNEYQITDRTGQTRWVYSKGLANYDELGRPLYLDGMMFDITERKNAEAAVQQSENRLRELLNITPVGCSINTREGKSVFRNQRLAELLGMSVDELDCISTIDYWANPDDREAFLAELQANGQVSGYRAHFKRVDGTRFAVLLSSSFEYIFGAEHIVSWSYDISELEKTERALTDARDAAEAATRAKSDFLANMSHEIRTPMNAIIGMSHLALQGPLDRKQRNYIEKVRRAGENLLGIINDILDFSKIEAGKLTMESTDFRLEDVLDHFANLVGLKAEEKQLDLLLRIHPDVPTSLIGDPLRLGQVLVNLGNNAVKFTERGEVLVGIETVALDSAGVELHFWVRDSGIGMSDEQLDRLFQSFNQADSSTTRKYGGTGLGLAICKNLVQLMHGRIWAESEPGKGSTFHFHARFGVQDKGSIRRMPDRQALEGIRVLVVDDNPYARDILVDMVHAFGMESDAATGGHEAIRMTELADRRMRPYALILMDWQMPDLDGISALESIRGMPLAQQPAGLLITSFNKEQALQAATQQNLSLSGVLTRPVTPSVLLESVGEALHKDLGVETRKNQRSDHTQQTRQKLQGARVLLVEDNEMNQELALELLGQAGIQVQLAVNGQDALDKLAMHTAEDRSFDCILMDCQMPVMDGYTATREIRKKPVYKDLPIIAMTANAMAGDREKVLEAGMNDHIAKPLNVEAMFATLSKWIKIDHRKDHSEEMASTDVAARDASMSVGANLEARLADAFSHLVGIDVPTGLATTAGNTDLYIRLLLKFKDSQGNFAGLFDAAKADRDVTAPARAAHTLKATAGNIGAKGIQAAAADLEQACMTGASLSELDGLLDAALQALDPVLKGLHVFADAVAKDGGGLKGVISVASEQAAATDNPLAGVPTEQLDRLEALLRESDADASDCLEEVLRLAPPPMPGQGLHKLAKALDEIDFDLALEVLLQLRGSNVQA